MPDLQDLSRKKLSVLTVGGERILSVQIVVAQDTEHSPYLD